MIKFECDNAEDLSTLFNSSVEARVEAATMREKFYKEQDKNGELRDQITDLKEQLRKSLAMPPAPHYDRALTELIVAVKQEQKISAIKVVREITGFGLKEAKDHVEAALSKAALPKVGNW